MKFLDLLLPRAGGRNFRTVPTMMRKTSATSSRDWMAMTGESLSPNLPWIAASSNSRAKMDVTAAATIPRGARKARKVRSFVVVFFENSRLR